MNIASLFILPVWSELALVCEMKQLAMMVSVDIAAARSVFACIHKHTQNQPRIGPNTIAESQTVMHFGLVGAQRVSNLAHLILPYNLLNFLRALPTAWVTSIFLPHSSNTKKLETLSLDCYASPLCTYPPWLSPVSRSSAEGYLSIPSETIPPFDRFPKLSKEDFKAHCQLINVHENYGKTVAKPSNT